MMMRRDRPNDRSDLVELQVQLGADIDGCGKSISERQLEHAQILLHLSNSVVSVPRWHPMRGGCVQRGAPTTPCRCGRAHVPRDSASAASNPPRAPTIRSRCPPEVQNQQCRAAARFADGICFAIPPGYLVGETGFEPATPTSRASTRDIATQARLTGDPRLAWRPIFWPTTTALTAPGRVATEERPPAFTVAEVPRVASEEAATAIA